MGGWLVENKVKFFIWCNTKRLAFLVFRHLEL